MKIVDGGRDNGVGHDSGQFDLAFFLYALFSYSLRLLLTMNNLAWNDGGDAICISSLPCLVTLLSYTRYLYSHRILRFFFPLIGVSCYSLFAGIQPSARQPASEPR